MTSGSPKASRDHPIACQLKGLTPYQRRRQAELLGSVRGKIKETRDLEEGFELTFAADQETVVELAEWITLERRCCRFAAFSIEWRDEESVIVRVTGPAGSREVLAAEMGLGASPPDA